jgi:hypothetical protein
MSKSCTICGAAICADNRVYFEARAYCKSCAPKSKIKTHTCEYCGACALERGYRTYPREDGSLRLEGGRGEREKKEE